MKNRIPYILIGFGLIGFFAQTLYRIQSDMKILEIQIKSQESAVIEGLKLKWRKFLEQKAQLELLPKDYALYWNRNGTELKSTFFPQKKTNLNWDEYREAVAKNHKDIVKNFLESALSRNSSWDRVLAIEEWKKNYNEYPKVESGYEETIINPEAQSAYRLIFSQFAVNKDFTYATDQITLDQVFYSVQKNGSIESFLPSAQNLKKTLFIEFCEQNKLTTARLLTNPLDIEIDKVEITKPGQSLLQFVLLFSSLLITSLGFIFFLLQLRDQKKLLLRRVSFLNQVVHELKTPLTGLKLHIQLIQRGQSKTENYDALNSSLDRLNTLFDDVVLMNRPFEKTKTEVISKEALNKTLADLKDEFSAFHYTKLFEHSMLGDLKRFKLVLRNLIKNAIRYGQEATLEIKNSTDNIEILIKDKGPGISVLDKDKIFEEFYRTEKAKTTNADGLGLGLFLVKKLCKEMNAEVSLLNPGEPGAVFRLKMSKGDQ